MTLNLFLSYFPHYSCIYHFLSLSLYSKYGCSLICSFPFSLSFSLCLYLSLPTCSFVNPQSSHASTMTTYIQVVTQVVMKLYVQIQPQRLFWSPNLAPSIGWTGCIFAAPALDNLLYSSHLFIHPHTSTTLSWLYPSFLSIKANF